MKPTQQEIEQATFALLYDGDPRPVWRLKLRAFWHWIFYPDE